MLVQSEQIRAWVEEFIANSDQFIVEIKVSPGKIAVFIDKPAAITIEECTALSRHLYAKLDALGLLETHELEVSSPGMDTPLKVPQQYYRRINREIKVIDANGKEYTGRLKSANDKGFEMEAITIIKEGKVKKEQKNDVAFNYTDIKETKLIFNFK